MGFKIWAKKIIYRGVFYGLQVTPTSAKHPKVTALLLLVQMGHTKYILMYKYIYFRIFWRLKWVVQ